MIVIGRLRIELDRGLVKITAALADIGKSEIPGALLTHAEARKFHDELGALLARWDESHAAAELSPLPEREPVSEDIFG